MSGGSRSRTSSENTNQNTSTNQNLSDISGLALQNSEVGTLDTSTTDIYQDNSVINETDFNQDNSVINETDIVSETNTDISGVYAENSTVTTTDHGAVESAFEFGAQSNETLLSVADEAFQTSNLALAKIESIGAKATSAAIEATSQTADKAISALLYKSANDAELLQSTLQNAKESTDAANVLAGLAVNSAAAITRSDDADISNTLIKFGLPTVGLVLAFAFWRK